MQSLYVLCVMSKDSEASKLSKTVCLHRASFRVTMASQTSCVFSRMRIDTTEAAVDKAAPDDDEDSLSVKLKELDVYANQYIIMMNMKIFWKGKGSNEKAVDQNGKTIVACDKNYYRPLEVNNLLGDSRKAKKILNWKPSWIRHLNCHNQNCYKHSR